MKNEFSKRNIYPSPAESFRFSLEAIEDIKGDALIVLDANVLLLPFTTNVKNVEAIKAVYGQLVQSDKIFLPAQAVREYLDNRAKKLTDISEALQKKSNQSFNYVGAHPLLESLDEFKAVLGLENELKKSIKDYQSKIRETLTAVQKWGWNDPVSKMYHEVLADRVLNDKELNVEEISKDLENRNTLKIPPGYKDQNKEQNQAGDLLIWHEILKIATEKEQHVIFVSGDEKVDWWHQSGKSPLYPRFELVDEFRGKTSGKSFHIVSLSKLLELFNAEEEVVKAVKFSEDSVKFKTKQSLYSNSELAERSLIIVKELRSVLIENRIESDRLLDQRMFEMRTATEGNRDEIWNKYNQADRDPTLKLMHFYNSNFKIDAIMLRDEMVSRLSNEVLESRESFSFHMYEHPTNPLGLERVIDDLEYLAKCLP